MGGRISRGGLLFFGVFSVILGIIILLIGSSLEGNPFADPLIYLGIVWVFVGLLGTFISSILERRSL